MNPAHAGRFPLLGDLLSRAMIRPILGRPVRHSIIVGAALPRLPDRSCWSRSRVSPALRRNHSSISAIVTNSVDRGEPAAAPVHAAVSAEPVAAFASAPPIWRQVTQPIVCRAREYPIAPYGCVRCRSAPASQGMDDPFGVAAFRPPGCDNDELRSAQAEDAEWSGLCAPRLAEVLSVW